MALETMDCPVCGPGTARLMLRARDLNLLLPGEFEIQRCRSCSLAFISPRPDAESIGDYYPTRYWSPPTPEGRRPYLDAGMKRTLDALVRDYPGGRVLDVGCAVGNLPAQMRQRGLDAVGLEPYEHACQIAREHYGLEVDCAFLQDTSYPDESFDAVTLFDVLEHVHDPLGDLRKIHALLKPGGSVYIKVPNVDALQRSLFGHFWYALDPPRHLFHFSPKSTARMLKAAGFATVDSRAIPEPEGAMVFEVSTLYMLRALLWRLRRVEVTPQEGHDMTQVLEGKVYSSVPSAGKRAFRWFIKHIAYAPWAIENLIGRSVEVLAVGRK